MKVNEKKQSQKKNLNETDANISSENASLVSVTATKDLLSPKVKKLTPLKKAAKLVQRLGSDDAHILKTMLEGALNRKVYKAYTGIRKSYEKQDWTKIVKGIDRNIGNAPD